MRSLLVIDDDPASCKLVAAIFKPEGFDVAAANDGPAGLARQREHGADVVLLDLQMPGMDGLEVLRELRAADPDLPVVMMTALRDVKTAVHAIQLGAFDYQTKPIDQDELVIAVRRAAEMRALKREVSELRRRAGADVGLAQLMGPSLAVARVVEQVATVAATTFSVLVIGETGTGKELVAQAIHRQSERRNQPFVAIDCGAIPEPLLESELFGYEKGAFTGAEKKKRGRFELAGGGTVFLDEIGNLPLAMQAKLLRVLESRQLHSVGSMGSTPVDVRFIAATNDDLQREVEAGHFRADLYFRLAQYTVTVPPLRERADDIAFLAERFREEVCVELRRPVQAITGDTIAALQRHAWPGNVRELRNAIRQAVLEAKGPTVDRIVLQHVAQSATPKRGAVPRGKTLRQIADDAAREAEREVIVATLRDTRGNKSRAAKILQTDYKTLHVKMKAMKIRARDFTT